MNFLSITEDYKQDRIFSLQAKKIFDRLYNRLKSNTIQIHIDYVHTKKCYFIDVLELDNSIKDLYIYFVPVSLIPTSNGKFLKSTVFNKIYLNTEDKKVDINKLSSYLYEQKKTLIHEITHYLDTKRLKNLKVSNTTKYLEKGDYESYYNSPLEYNASYQQMIFSLYYMAKNKKRDSIEEKITDFPFSFNEFIKNSNIYWKFIYLHYLKKLTDQNRKKFLSRLSVAYPKILQKIYSREEIIKYSSKDKFYE